MGDVRNANKISVELSEVKRSLGRPKHRWENNIRIDAKKIER
jgi:hypothetical protein